MYPFWEIAIKPVLQAIGPKRVVEIGALRGDTTQLVLDVLGPECDFHVIDPLPEFDPDEHAARFGGRYIFHRDISHNVLPELPVVDVALIDGDHNWYTVFHELRMLAATAEKEGTELPVMIMHDVCWPYGRRDLYYSPDRIPAEYRQPYEHKGMRLGKATLAAQGGLNRTLDNAVVEGGERNGVITALDDFLAEHVEPVRRVVLPIYFGLAIVAEQRTLDRLPELAAVLDTLEGVETRQPLLELAEQLRLESTVSQHDLLLKVERTTSTAAAKYLSLLKGALTNEVSLENETRLHYLARCISVGATPEYDKLRDPARHHEGPHRARREARRTGLGGTPITDALFALAPSGRARLDALHDVLDELRVTDVPGDLIDVGTRRGGAAILMRGYLDIWAMGGRTVWVADRFDAAGGGTDDESSGHRPDETSGHRPDETSGHRPDPGGGVPLADSGLEGDLRRMRSDLSSVRDGFANFELLDARVRFLQGQPADAIGDAPIDRLALIRIDATVAGGPNAALAVLYPRLAIGGRVVVDHLEETDDAELHAFRERRRITSPLVHPAFGMATWTKEAEAPEPTDPASAQPTRLVARRAPLIGEAPPVDACDLSVVVVFYNMAREARRTLHSLSRAYQRDIDDLAYEVLVVDNGSAEDQRLTPEFVARFGEQFRLISVTEDAEPSPVKALNLAMREARGRSFALMIDGAHVLTPGVLHFGMVAMRAYKPAIVATQQWYVGPGQQNDVAAVGYGQGYEDSLFEQIEWPADGYRLFDIGHFIGERDWFDPMWESNCLFVPRWVLSQTGAFDESFDMPGGGYANLDLFERVAWTPGVTTTTIIGEGTFHQFHNGKTTNHDDHIERQAALRDYAKHYEELRGKPFRAAPGPYRYVGLAHEPSKRTRARRSGATVFAHAGVRNADGRPASSMPMPDDLIDAYTAAFWMSNEWQQVSWFGRSTRTPPSDLIIHQELIHEVKPDWVIKVGEVAGGGFMLFLAQVCELHGRGQVLAIDPAAAPTFPTHPRLHVLREPVRDPATVATVRSMVPEGSKGIVLFGLTHRRNLLDTFDLYEQFVSPGSYAVFHNTIVNGNPVWTSFGPGPREAARRIGQDRHDFVLDTAGERYGSTFIRRGVLKRLR